MTEFGKTISYDKIWVEVSNDSPLPHSVEVCLAFGRTVTMDIKYPWRPVKCPKMAAVGSVIATGVRNVAVPAKVWVVKAGKAIVSSEQVGARGF